MKKHEHSYHKSHFYQHHHTAGHKIDLDNFKNLDRTSNDLKLQLKKMLLIRKYNSSLNRQLNSELLTLIIRTVNRYLLNKFIV